MFVFNIKNQKKLQSKKYRNIRNRRINAKIYDEIKNIERKTKKKILVININDIVPYVFRYKVERKFGILSEPFLFADTFRFTIYKDTLIKETILNIYEKNKKK